MRDVSSALRALALVILVAGCGSPIGSERIPSEGRLLIHTETGSIFSVRPDGSDRVDIAAPPAIGTHLQPTWSPEGDLIAYASATGTGGEIRVVGSDGADLRSVEVDAAPFYLCWSPDGSRIATLGPSPATGIEALVVDVGAELTVRRLGGGQPFYFSWAPDGEAVLSNVGGARLADQPLGGDPVVISESPALFQAPDWDGERRVFAVAGGPGGVLIAEEGGERQEVVEFSGAISFDLAGDRLAYLVSGDGQVVAARREALERALPGVLTVVDLESGEQTAAGRDGVLAFQWSPDGASLLFLRAAGDAELRWHVWSPEVTMDFEAFVPTRLYLSQYLPFFDQYARSQTQWSPASDAFAYAGTGADGRMGVWVQDLVAGSAPFLAAEGGRHASWSGR
jgi:TolB protein